MPKYLVEISPVREAWLLGGADLGFWRERLEPEGLYPAASDGRARLLISGVDFRCLGFRLRELSISVFVDRQEDGAARNGVYLAHAFHSSRFFAWIERTMFGTPYYPETIQVETRLPAAIRLGQDDNILLRAEMSADASARPPVRGGHEDWEVPIFIPTAKRREREPGKMFFAKLAGESRFYPFMPEKDVLVIKPSPSHPVLQWLIDSGFTGHEWMVRENATHARSKTVLRVALTDDAA